MAELGFMGMPSRGVRRRGMDNVCYAIAMEEISRACASTGVIMSVTIRSRATRSSSSAPRRSSGNISCRWLRKKLGCFGLTEPAPAPTPVPEDDRGS